MSRLYHLAADGRDRLAYFAVRLLICTIQALPMTSCERIANGLAWLASDLLKVRRGVILANLEKAFPDYSSEQRLDVCRGMWRHLVLMVFEIAHTHRRVHLTNWRRYVELVDEPEMVRNMLAPSPRVFVAGHFGNFEVSGYMCALLGFPTFTIARPLDNRYLDEFVGRFRGATGQFILPKHGSSGVVQNVLEANETIALLGDQHAGPKGCWVDFFSQPTSVHKAVALFPLTSGAQMIVTNTVRKAEPMQFAVFHAGVLEAEAARAEMNVKSVSQWYLGVMEEAIRLAPEQYWWLHRIWKSGPPQRRRSA